ncbi:hypothetical protein M8J76_006160 [Diaphorina citri]|nr:hypothetical protein M8J76_006160 [Diaphorina citri]
MLSYLKCSLLLILCTKSAYCSLGDSFPTYRECVVECKNNMCESDGISYQKAIYYYPFESLRWRCENECRYLCMWQTLVIFENKGWKTPQFHGKWPFLRFLIFQEPASMLFSMMNFVTNFILYKKLTKHFRPSSSMYLIYVILSLVAMNCWLWSTLFHSRDTPFFETMDYLCAFSLNQYFFFIVFYRIFIASRSNLIKFLFTSACLLFYVNHAWYLTTHDFDYTYNMSANIVFASTSIVLTLLWSYLNWRTLPHVQNLLVVSGLLALGGFFEITDFPPMLWILDSHSLFHLVTVPIPLFLYKFAYHDGKYINYKYITSSGVVADSGGGGNNYIEPEGICIIQNIQNTYKQSLEQLYIRKEYVDHMFYNDKHCLPFHLNPIFFT